ncbi:MAG TPA: hypothetical protein VGE41_13910, partial [Verrucomicrobiae bacterium]
MNLSAWGNLFGLIGLEAFVAIILGALTARLLNTQWRLAVWRVVMIGLLTTFIVECCGLTRRGTVSIPTEKTQSLHQVVVKIGPISREAASISRSDAGPLKNATALIARPAESTWWPALIWLGGFVILAGRAILGRL